MRDLFPEFYDRDDAGWQALWDNATFVLDANVLLRLGVLPPKSQAELFTVLEELRNRLWIPYQAALEYQRNRRGKLTGAAKDLKAQCALMLKGVDGASAALTDLEVDKWTLHNEGADVQARLTAAREAVVALTGQLEAKFEALSDDTTIRERLDELLAGRIGNAPSSPEDMNELIRDGDARFASQIAPGFLDAPKAETEEPTFRHKGITYQHKFGDLILWRQLLAHVRDAELSHVIFVTDDRKGDWWQTENRKIIGPHPDLLHEVKTAGGVSDFHMYTLTQFLTRAKERLNATVSDETLSDIEASANLTLPSVTVSGTATITQHADISASLGALASSGLAANVHDRSWEKILLPALQAKYVNCHKASGTLYSFLGDGSPDFIASDDNGDVFFAVVDLNGIGEIEWTQRLADKARIMLKTRLTHTARVVILIPMPAMTFVPTAYRSFQKAISMLLPEHQSYVSGLVLVAPGPAVTDVFPI